MEQEENKTVKVLKITSYKGIVNYVPFNRANKKYHETKHRILSPEKKAKAKIDEVDLSIEEAAALGIYEAYEILKPPVKKTSDNSQVSDVLKLVLDQNKQLIEQNKEAMDRLKVLEENKTPAKAEKTSKN